MTDTLKTVPLSILFFAAPLQAEINSGARVESWNKTVEAASMVVANIPFFPQDKLEKGRLNQVLKNR